MTVVAFADILSMSWLIRYICLNDNPYTSSRQVQTRRVKNLDGYALCLNLFGEATTQCSKRAKNVH
jgi:hypothetical protein